MRSQNFCSRTSPHSNVAAIIFLYTSAIGPTRQRAPSMVDEEPALLDRRSLKRLSRMYASTKSTSRGTMMRKKVTKFLKKKHKSEQVQRDQGEDSSSGGEGSGASTPKDASDSLTSRLRRASLSGNGAPSSTERARRGSRGSMNASPGNSRPGSKGSTAGSLDGSRRPHRPGHSTSANFSKRRGVRPAYAQHHLARMEAKASAASAVAGASPRTRGIRGR